MKPKRFTYVQKLHFSSSLAPGAAFWYAVIEEQNTDKSKESFEYILKTNYIWICFARRSLFRKGTSQKDLAVLPALPARYSEYHLGLALEESDLKIAQERLLPLREVVKGNNKQPNPCTRTN